MFFGVFQLANELILHLGCRDWFQAKLNLMKKTEPISVFDGSYIK